MSYSFHFWKRGFLYNILAIRLKPELKELFLFSLLFSFASALIAVFEPIFFYKEGISLSYIALYYALHYSIYVVTLPLGAMFAVRFGMEKSLSVSLPIFVLYFLCLAMMPVWPQLFWAALVLLTLHKTFYWPAYHAHFARLGDSGNRGTELSWMTALKFGVGILGPLIGGVVATQFGFPVLFVVGAITVLSSAAPLLKTRERFQARTMSYGAPWRIVFSKRYRGMALAMLGMGENLIDLVFWPIFMFIILGSAEQVGFFTSISIAVMAVISFFIGELSDRYPRQVLLRIHIPFMMVGHLLRTVAFTPLRILSIDGFNKVVFAGVNIPMLYRLYTEGKSAGYVKYMTAFEVVLSIAKALTAWTLVIVFASTLPSTGFAFAFILAALMAGMYFFL